MDWLVLPVYPILLVVLFWGCKIYGPKKWNEEAFSLRQTKALLGFIALCIMLHHCSQKNAASWLDPTYIVHGLDFFVSIGYVLVAFFTFLSGYGLYKSFKSKKNYLSAGFLVHRILPIIVLGYVVALIFLIVRILLKEPMGGGTLFFYLSGMKMANPNGWYVIVIPFFYLAFFLAFRFIKSEKAALLAIVLFTVAFQLLGTSLDHNDWWMCGEWWYNSIHLFSVGIFFAMHEEKITAHVKKFFLLYLILGFFALPVLGVITEIARNFISYYGEYSASRFCMLRRCICLSTEIAFSSAAVFWVLLLGLKIRIGNRFLALMGSITLQFYLIHGLFTESFCFAFNSKLQPIYHIEQPWIYVIVVFVLGLISALLLKGGEDLIRSRLLSRRSKTEN